MTCVEVAVWAKQVTVGEAEEYTQYSLTLARTRRNPDGSWVENGSYRSHDVPVLLCLVAQAYQWCVARRTEVRTESGDESPP